MEENLEKVLHFREMFSIPTPQKPCLVDEKEALDLVDMIQSELDEIRAAIRKGDLAGVLDGIIDTDYFTKQAIFTFGLQNIYQTGFDRVQYANMSKPCDSKEHAEATQAQYKEKGIDTYIKENEKFGKFLVKRTDTHKCLKAKGWQEPTFDDLLV